MQYLPFDVVKYVRWSHDTEQRVYNEMFHTIKNEYLLITDIILKLCIYLLRLYNMNISRRRYLLLLLLLFFYICLSLTSQTFSHAEFTIWHYILGNQLNLTFVPLYIVTDLFRYGNQITLNINLKTQVQ